MKTMLDSYLNNSVLLCSIENNTQDHFFISIDTNTLILTKNYCLLTKIGLKLRLKTVVFDRKSLISEKICIKL